MIKSSKKYFSFFLVLLLSMAFIAMPADAKKKKKKRKQKEVIAKIVATRINAMNAEDKRRFDSLSKKQRSKILKGKINKGFNAWMVKLARGEPFYATEHHPTYKDYEEVWLYVKPDIDEKIDEERIIDPQTNWPTLHRKVRKKVCYVSDFFVLWDRGVVEEYFSAKERKQYGSCVIETQEAFLPIVDGKPVEPR